MKLHLDDNLASASLASHLRNAGHVAVLPSDIGTAGFSDAQHLAKAANSAAVSLTADHEDFLDLHLLVQATGGRHPGILVVRRDNDASRDMKDRDVVRAIANLEAASVPIENELHVLNHWR
jgi:predicted nuclease of predicted toxin-antitoxin system